MNAPAKIRKPLKLIKIGNSIGVILPKEALAKQNLELGDALDLVEHSDGMSLHRHDAGFAEQMAVARSVMKKRRNALRELAK